MRDQQRKPSRQLARIHFLRGAYLVNLSEKGDEIHCVIENGKQGVGRVRPVQRLKVVRP